VLYAGFGPASVQLFRDMCINNGLDIPAPVTNFAFVCLSTACTVPADGQDTHADSIDLAQLSSSLIIKSLFLRNVTGQST